MADVLNRNGYRLRKVLKAKPLKKLPETDAIFANIREKDGNLLEDENSMDGGQVKRLSIDCKATVNIGDYSRGGMTRGDASAADHDMGCEEKYTPLWHRRRGRRGVTSDLWRFPSRPAISSWTA